jgi:hypothetical protein
LKVTCGSTGALKVSRAKSLFRCDMLAVCGGG